MKKLISLVLTICILTASLSTFASAQSSELQPVPSKEQFARMFSSEYKPNFAESEEDLDRYAAVAKYFAGVNVDTKSSTLSNSMPGKNQEAADALSSLGFHVYSYAEPGIAPCSDGGDIKLNNADVIYDSYNNQWMVCGGGYWKNNNWQNDSFLSGFWGMPRVGATQNVGGQDGVGVALLSTSGPKPVLVRSYAYVHDGDGREKYYYNPMNPDTSTGAFFDYQDYLRLKDLNVAWGNVTYMGYGFSAMAIYNSSFANYHGRARTYYAHTWNSTTVSGVGASSNGFNISFASGNSRFVIYQSGETVF